MFDKSNNNCFQTNIKNIAAENGFYELNLKDVVLTMEPSLARLESNTSGIIKKLIQEKCIKALDENKVLTLAFFLSIQFVRTKEHRERFSHLGKLFTQKLLKMGVSKESIEEDIIGTRVLPEDKLFGLRSIMSAKEFVPHFLNKAWLLYETSSKFPFYISDNPIVLHNDNDYGPYGNIGLAVKGIEIYLPISSKLCLGLVCPSIAEEFEKAHESIKSLDKLAPGLVDKIIKDQGFSRSFCDGFEKGTPIRIHEENVIRINSLQVMYSTRFVYCETNSFGLVKKMISDDEKYREGIKPTIN